MKILQDILEQQMREHFTLENIGAPIIRKQFEEHGIELNERQILKLKAKLKRMKPGAQTLSFTDGSFFERLFERGKKSEVSFEFTQENMDEQCERLIEEFDENVTRAIPEIVKELSPIYLASLKRRSRRMLREHRKEQKTFESRLLKKWKKGIDLLEMLVVIALEAGEDFNESNRPKAAEQNDYVFEALVRLHARGCQVASEVLALLKSGHADGAHARWRTIHEIAVVSFFIGSHGNELAERYLLHGTIEEFRAATHFRRHCEALGYEDLTEAEFKKIKSAKESLVERYGANYGTLYGWAADVLGIGKPNFSQIEAKAGFDHFRPFYKMASHNIHANPKGVYYRLGLYPDGPDLLLSGSSDFGLADPGHSTALSLAQITVNLLTRSETLDEAVLCGVLLTLQAEIGEAFWDAQAEILEASQQFE